MVLLMMGSFFLRITFVLRSLLITWSLFSQFRKELVRGCREHEQVGKAGNIGHCSIWCLSLLLSSVHHPPVFQSLPSIPGLALVSLQVSCALKVRRTLLLVFSSVLEGVRGQWPDARWPRR